MKHYKATIEIMNYWHVGSGHGSKGDLDATVLRDANQLPYLPGRTLKGLLREGMRNLALVEEKAAEQTEILFGKAATEGDHHGSQPGSLRFTDARLPETLSKAFNASDNPESLRQGLFDSVSSTSIDDEGQAKDKSLRTIEVAVPMQLEATITQTGEDDPLELIEKAASYIRTLEPIVTEDWVAVAYKSNPATQTKENSCPRRLSRSHLNPAQLAASLRPWLRSRA